MSTLIGKVQSVSFPEGEGRWIGMRRSLKKRRHWGRNKGPSRLMRRSKENWYWKMSLKFQLKWSQIIKHNREDSLRLISRFHSLLSWQKSLNLSKRKTKLEKPHLKMRPSKLPKHSNSRQSQWTNKYWAKSLTWSKENAHNNNQNRSHHITNTKTTRMTGLRGRWKRHRKNTRWSKKKSKLRTWQKSRQTR